MNEFMDKVKVEREIINLINMSVGEPQLCGLTSVSIINWSNAHKNCNEMVVEQLQRLSELVGVLCERSGERFDDEHRINSKKIDEGIHSLKKEIGC